MFARRKPSATRSALRAISAAALAGWLFYPAAAQQGSASTQITITGVAAPVCTLPAPTVSSSATNATFAANTVTITQFIDPQTALVNLASLQLQYSNAMCNYNAVLSLASKNGGMIATNGAPITAGSGAFLQTVPYAVTANWGGVSVQLETSKSTAASAPVGGANAGNLTLTFQTQASTIPVVQGSYQDVVTLKIGAAM